MNMTDFEIEWRALFFSAFLAATLLPAQSEALLFIMAQSAAEHTWLLVGIATAGNVLGALVNWALGRYLLHFQDKKWFPVRKNGLERAERFYAKYGVWSLLLAWVPIIGDPLTLVAGVLRTPLRIFLPLVFLGKLLRYIGVISLV